MSNSISNYSYLYDKYGKTAAVKIDEGNKEEILTGNGKIITDDKNQEWFIFDTNQVSLDNFQSVENLSLSQIIVAFQMGDLTVNELEKWCSANNTNNLVVNEDESNNKVNVSFEHNGTNVELYSTYDAAQSQIDDIKTNNLSTYHTPKDKSNYYNYNGSMINYVNQVDDMDDSFNYRMDISNTWAMKVYDKILTDEQKSQLTRGAKFADILMMLNKEQAEYINNNPYFPMGINISAVNTNGQFNESYYKDDAGLQLWDMARGARPSNADDLYYIALQYFSQNFEHGINSNKDAYIRKGYVYDVDKEGDNIRFNDKTIESIQALLKKMNSSDAPMRKNEFGFGDDIPYNYMDLLGLELGVEYSNEEIWQKINIFCRSIDSNSDGTNLSIEDYYNVLNSHNIINCKTYKECEIEISEKIESLLSEHNEYMNSNPNWSGWQNTSLVRDWQNLSDVTPDNYKSSLQNTNSEYVQRYNELTSNSDIGRNPNQSDFTYASNKNNTGTVSSGTQAIETSSNTNYSEVSTVTTKPAKSADYTETLFDTNVPPKYNREEYYKLLNNIGKAGWCLFADTDHGSRIFTDSQFDNVWFPRDSQAKMTEEDFINLQILNISYLLHDMNEGKEAIPEPYVYDGYNAYSIATGNVNPPYFRIGIDNDNNVFITDDTIKCVQKYLDTLNEKGIDITQDEYCQRFGINPNDSNAEIKDKLNKYFSQMKGAEKDADGNYKVSLTEYYKHLSNTGAKCSDTDCAGYKGRQPLELRTKENIEELVNRWNMNIDVQSQIVDFGFRLEDLYVYAQDWNYGNPKYFTKENDCPVITADTLIDNLKNGFQTESTSFKLATNPELIIALKEASNSYGGAENLVNAWFGGKNAISPEELLARLTGTHPDGGKCYVARHQYSSDLLQEMSSYGNAGKMDFDINEYFEKLPNGMYAMKPGKTYYNGGMRSIYSLSDLDTRNYLSSQEYLKRIDEWTEPVEKTAPKVTAYSEDVKVEAYNTAEVQKAQQKSKSTQITNEIKNFLDEKLSTIYNKYFSSIDDYLQKNGNSYKRTQYGDLSVAGACLYTWKNEEDRQAMFNEVQSIINSALEKYSDVITSIVFDGLHIEFTTKYDEYRGTGSGESVGSASNRVTGQSYPGDVDNGGPRNGNKSYMGVEPCIDMPLMYITPNIYNSGIPNPPHDPEGRELLQTPWKGIYTINDGSNSKLYVWDAVEQKYQIINGGPGVCTNAADLNINDNTGIGRTLMSLILGYNRTSAENIFEKDGKFYIIDERLSFYGDAQNLDGLEALQARLHEVKIVNASKSGTTNSPKKVNVEPSSNPITTPESKETRTSQPKITETSKNVTNEPTVQVQESKEDSKQEPDVILKNGDYNAQANANINTLQKMFSSVMKSSSGSFLGFYNNERYTNIWNPHNQEWITYSDTEAKKSKSLKTSNNKYIQGQIILKALKQGLHFTSNPLVFKDNKENYYDYNTISGEFVKRKNKTS